MVEYTVVERKQKISAPPEKVASLIVDFHRWVDWSPWEEIDPQLQRTYGGPESGVGSTYEWSGNRKAGAGKMTITSVTPSKIDIDLDFTKPFKSQSKTHFDINADGDGSVVTWQVHTPKTMMTRIFGIFMNMDKMVGGDLDKGLTKLNTVAGS